MIIPVEELDKYCPEFKGAIHGGAHALEEYLYYLPRNSGLVYWVEANPLLAKQYQRKLKYNNNLSKLDVLYNYALWHTSGETMTLNIANNGQSSSLLELGTHAVVHPEVEYVDKVDVETITLDDLAEKRWLEDEDPGMLEAQFLNLDLQGVELDVLRGATDLLTNSLRYLYLEVNRDPLYKGCGLVGEIDEFVGRFGFERVLTEIYPHLGWGDSLFVKR